MASLALSVVDFQQSRRFLANMSPRFRSPLSHDIRAAPAPAPTVGIEGISVGRTREAQLCEVRHQLRRRTVVYHVTLRHERRAVQHSGDIGARLMQREHD